MSGCFLLALLRLRDGSMLPLVASFGSIKVSRDIRRDVLWAYELPDR